MVMSEKNIELYEFDSFGDAQRSAADAATSSFSQFLPAIMFEQAGRVCFATSFPLFRVTSMVKFDSAIKGANDPENYTNRPIMPEHVRAISEYLVETERYILPGITLNVKETIKVYSIRSASPVKMAIIVLPAHATFYVTDGQHRLKAVADALAKKVALREDALPVTIVVESDEDQIHQDFADCAQTRPIPPALLTLYNRSDELSKLTVEVAQNVPFFEKRLEKVGNTVSKRSTNFYTLNHLRMSIASAMTGNSASGGSALSRATGEKLSTDAERDEWKNQLVRFYDTLSDEIPEWRIVRDANMGNGQIADLINFRAAYFHFTGTGLAILGAVAYRIFKFYDDATVQQQKVVELAKLDWRRHGDDGKPNPFWVGNIVTDDGKMITSRNAAEAAVNKILKLLDIKKKNGAEPEPQTSPADTATVNA
jgi:DNA sulfur modification protein DndB